MERPTYIKSIPLLLSVPRGSPGFMDGCICPNTHLWRATWRGQHSNDACQVLEPRKARETGELREPRLGPRSRMALAGVCLRVEAEVAQVRPLQCSRWKGLVSMVAG
jgi:hypothetical protein